MPKASLIKHALGHNLKSTILILGMAPPAEPKPLIHPLVNRSIVIVMAIVSLLNLYLARVQLLLHYLLLVKGERIEGEAGDLVPFVKGPKEKVGWS